MVDSKEFNSFFSGLEKKVNEYISKSYPNCPPRVFSFKNNRLLIKIICDGSAYAFIDKSNGDVLKPASWNAPAKHARGNIFADDNGLNCCGPYGIAYLR